MEGGEKGVNFPDLIYRWAVPFAPGKLVAKGSQHGKTAKSELVSATAPARIELTADRKTITADGRDAVHIVAQLVDAKGNPVRTDERKITFTVTGPGRWLGLDNGAADSTRQKSPDGSGFVPLTRGKIQIQSEAAENNYRDLRIETISSFPEFLRDLTTKSAAPAVPYKPQPAEGKK